MSVRSEVIWMDGKFIPYDQAQVHVLSHTLHYGLGVFDRPVFKDGLLPFTCGSLELLRESDVQAAGKRGKELLLSYNKALQGLPGDARFWPHVLMTEAYQ